MKNVFTIETIFLVNYFSIETRSINSHAVNPPPYTFNILGFWKGREQNKLNIV